MNKMDQFNEDTLATKHPVFNRLTGRHTLEAVFRGVLALLVVGTAAAVTVLAILGYGIRTVVEETANGRIEKIVPLSEDPLAMLAVGCMTTLAATIVTHYFKASD